MDQQPKVEARVDRSCLHPRGKYTVYRVVIQRQSSCGSDEIILFKRFSDFLRLRHHLNAVHKALGYREPLPQLLNGKYFDRFQPSVIETRRQALDGLIKFIASNDHLYCHTHFTLFAAGGLSVDLTSNQGLSFLPLDNKSSKSQEIRPTPSLNVQSPKQLPLKPPKVRKATASEHFTSPLSSDTESDLEGDSLLLVWECNASQSTNIAESIQAAKNSTLKGRWIDALRLYKDAISGLTTELKSELNGADKKEEYRCLLAACLAKAEFIHGEYLSRPAPQCTNEENQSCHTWMKSPKLASLCQDPVLLTSFGSTDELRKLKICEVEEQGLVVCDRLDSLVRYSLKSRCAPSTLNGSFPQIRSATLNGPAADCILPVGSVPFMCRLRRLIETEDRIFFLTERTKGELLLVDWLNTYLERRVASLMSTAKHRGLNSAMRHLSWCKRVSIRVRHMTLIHLQEFIDDSASPRCMSDAISQGSNSRISGSSGSLNASMEAFRSSVSPSKRPVTEKLLSDEMFDVSSSVTLEALMSRYPPGLVTRGSRSRSADRLSSPQEWIGADDVDYNILQSKQREEPLLPERRVLQWAAELVSVVSWLHARDITLRHLTRSRVYLAQGGHIELDYFFRWPTCSDRPHRHRDYCHSPEVLLGPLTRHFLSGMSWETDVACDWWSVGVILYELFTGVQLHESHPSGLSSVTPLELPPTLSSDVVNLLVMLLKLNPVERLSDTSVKSHPLFASVDWASIENVT